MPIIAGLICGLLWTLLGVFLPTTEDPLAFVISSIFTGIILSLLINLIPVVMLKSFWFKIFLGIAVFPLGMLIFSVLGALLSPKGLDLSGIVAGLIIVCLAPFSPIFFLLAILTTFLCVYLNGKARK